MTYAPMTLTYDDVFEYPGFGGCPSRCGMQIWDAPGRPPVVLVTNPAAGSGTSVTNFAAELAALACRRFTLEPRALVWIECYEVTAGDGSLDYEVSRRTHRRSFDRVFFTISTNNRISQPCWTPFGLTAAEALVGHSL